MLTFTISMSKMHGAETLYVVSTPTFATLILLGHMSAERKGRRLIYYVV